jgi:hypothetical protein
LPAVFRCYLSAGASKTLEFPRPGGVLSLYFSGIISGISELSHRRCERGSAQRIRFPA